MSHPCIKIESMQGCSRTNPCTEEQAATAAHNNGRECPVAGRKGTGTSAAAAAATAGADRSTTHGCNSQQQCMRPPASHRVCKVAQTAAASASVRSSSRRCRALCCMQHQQAHRCAHAAALLGMALHVRLMHHSGAEACSNAAMRSAHARRSSSSHMQQRCCMRGVHARTQLAPMASAALECSMALQQQAHAARA